MLNYSILNPQGILLLKPHAPLSKEDFGALSTVVDSYLCGHTKLYGVMIHTQEFPGWEDFGEFTAHMHFVNNHHKKIEHVAIVTDGQFASIAESLGAHFTSAVIKRFPFCDEAKALEWLEPA